MIVCLWIEKPCTSARSVAASYKPPMLVTWVRLPACACWFAGTYIYKQKCLYHFTKNDWNLLLKIYFRMNTRKCNHMHCLQIGDAGKLHIIVDSTHISHICKFSTHQKCYNITICNVLAQHNPTVQTTLASCLLCHVNAWNKSGAPNFEKYFTLVMFYNVCFNFSYMFKTMAAQGKPAI